MKTSDIGIAVVIYAVATWFLVMTLQLPEPAQTYPLILLSALYLCTTLFIGKQVWAWSRNHEFSHDLPEVFNGFLWKQFFGVVVGCVLYLAFLNILGYYVASVLYLLLAQFALKVKPIPAIVTCVCIMATTYFVFSMFLRVPLPVGTVFGG